MKPYLIALVVLVVGGVAVALAQSGMVLRSVGTTPTGTDITPPGNDGQGIAPYTSGIRGTVLLGPTCPVQRIPPDPSCEDKPYATSVSVYRTGGTQVFATTKSGADGTFQFSLPPGNYTLQASGGAVMPRCASVDTVVGPSSYVTTNISCDSGIR